MLADLYFFYFLSTGRCFKAAPNVIFSYHMQVRKHGVESGCIGGEGRVPPPAYFLILLKASRVTSP